MKSIIKLFVFCFGIFLFSGCYKEDRGDVTVKGKNIHDGWSNGMDEILNIYLDIPFRFNAWLEADEQDKDRIKFNYLREYTIREVDEYSWELYQNAQLAYRFVFDKYLTEESANWTVRFYNPSPREYVPFGSYYTLDLYQYLGATITVRKTGLNEWELFLQDNLMYDSDFSFKITNVAALKPVSLKETVFILEGYGTFIYKHNNELVILTFGIDEKLEYLPANVALSADRYLWSRGEARIVAERRNISNAQQTAISTEFLQSLQGRYQVNITYRGVTETWLVE